MKAFALLLLAALALAAVPDVASHAEAPVAVEMAEAGSPLGDVEVVEAAAPPPCAGPQQASRPEGPHRVPVSMPLATDVPPPEA